MSKLEILTGQFAQHQFLIESDEIWIGRDAQCDICINEAGVSRRHAQIIRTPDQQHWLQDAGGSFGTTLNGQSIERALLQDGDELTLGRVKLKFSEEKTTFANVSAIMAAELAGQLATAEPTATGVSAPAAPASPSSPALDVVDDPLGPDPSEHTNVTGGQVESTVIAPIGAITALAQPPASVVHQTEEIEMLDEEDMLGEDDLIELTDEELEEDDDEDRSEHVGEVSFLIEPEGEEAQDGTVMAPMPTAPSTAPSSPLIPKPAPVTPLPPTAPPPAPATPIRKPKSRARSLPDFERHTLTRIRADEVKELAKQKLSSSLKEEVREATSATKSRGDVIHQEMGRLRHQLDEREERILQLLNELEEQKLDQQRSELLQTTLRLYREDNERLNHQLEMYQEAADENEELLKKMHLFRREIDDLSKENKVLRRKLVQYHRLLVQHDLLPKRASDEKV